MAKKFSFQSILRPLLAFVLVAVLVIGQAAPAFAARTGGRMGGSAFRSRPVPSRSYSRTPRTTTSPGYGYRGGYGGGFGFPFLLPFFGFGGVGSLFSILIFIAIANFVVSAFRRVSEDSGAIFESSTQSSNPKVAIAKLQLGVLAEARHLQPELDKLAMQASTGSPTGLTQLLQETTLALLRHPEYWVYGDSKIEQARLTDAEAKFNRFALTERSKFQSETLSNVKGELKQSDSAQLVKSDEGAPSEYILVTLLVAAQGNFSLGNVQTAEDLRTALNILGGISSEQMLALEVLWTPQASGDTLTSDDLIEAYPGLKVLG